MASWKGKSKEMEGILIADGVKYTHPSKGHYRPHHIRLNSKLEHYDNDIMFLVVETKITKIDREFGINKRRWEFSDYDYNDEMKDGNGRY